MFDDVLQRVEAALDVPYPHRARILRELEADLWACYGALRDEGASETEARAAALRDLGLDDHALRSLSALHTPAIRRILLRLPAPAREPAEWLAAGASLTACLYFFLKEVPMLEFIRQGGIVMPIILIIGGAAMLLQMRRAFSWFVTRDHSPAALARNTATPLYLAAAALCISIAGSALGFRAVLGRISDGTLPPEVMIPGAFEALAPVLLGGVLATLVVLIQAALAAGLRAMQVKQPV